MRFISRFGKYGVQVRPQIAEHYATGQSKVIQTMLNAQFDTNTLLPHERELALSNWTFNGSYQEMDEVTTVAPDYRIGVFDSRQAQIDNQWSDDERRYVEEHLLRSAQQSPNDLMAVEEKLVPSPWPRYDDFEGSLIDLMQKLIDDGYDLAAVLAYEQQSQNRVEVVDALEQMIEDAKDAPAVEYEEVIG